MTYLSCSVLSLRHLTVPFLGRIMDIFSHPHISFEGMGDHMYSLSFSKVCHSTPHRLLLLSHPKSLESSFVGLLVRLIACARALSLCRRVLIEFSRRHMVFVCERACERGAIRRLKHRRKKIDDDQPDYMQLTSDDRMLILHAYLSEACDENVPSADQLLQEVKMFESSARPVLLGSLVGQHASDSS